MQEGATVCSPSPSVSRFTSSAVFSSCENCVKKKLLRFITFIDISVSRSSNKKNNESDTTRHTQERRKRNKHRSLWRRGATQRCSKVKTHLRAGSPRQNRKGNQKKKKKRIAVVLPKSRRKIANESIAFHYLRFPQYLFKRLISMMHIYFYVSEKLCQ